MAVTTAVYLSRHVRARPIKIEGNDMSAVTKGGTSARAQAYVLSLYDTNQDQSTSAEDCRWLGRSCPGSDLDTAVKGKLKANSKDHDPQRNRDEPDSRRKPLDEFKAKYPNTKCCVIRPGIECSSAARQ